MKKDISPELYNYNKFPGPAFARVGTPEEIAREIGADGCVFQDLAELEQVVKNLNPDITGFDTSCFSGCYLSGDIDEAYLQKLSNDKSSPSNIPTGLIHTAIRINNHNDDEE